MAYELEIEKLLQDSDFWKEHIEQEFDINENATEPSKKLRIFYEVPIPDIVR